jgi:hypothetical protein
MNDLRGQIVEDDYPRNANNSIARNISATIAGMTKFGLRRVLRPPADRI